MQKFSELKKFFDETQFSCVPIFIMPSIAYLKLCKSNLDDADDVDDAVAAADDDYDDDDIDDDDDDDSIPYPTNFYHPFLFSTDFFIPIRFATLFLDHI